MSYEWDLGRRRSIRDATGETVTFDAATVARITVGPCVTDRQLAADTDTATSPSQTWQPVAEAGAVRGQRRYGHHAHAAGLHDPGNDIVSYEWDLDNDGDPTKPTGAHGPTSNSTDEGPYTVGLSGHGRRWSETGTDTADVTVDNVAPTADAGGP